MTRLRILAAATIASLAAISVPALSQEAGMKMEGMDMKDVPCCEGMTHGIGVINSIDAEVRKINLAHEPIPAIGWGEMTMDFEAGKMVDLSQYNKGDRVQFALKQGRDKTYRIMMMCKTDAEEVVEGLCMKDMKKDGMMQHPMMDDEGANQSADRPHEGHQD